ncbi:hypothetical protein BHM03_00060693, partial [Ensete ventricosum]
MCCRRHTSLGGRWDPQPWLEKQPKQGEQRGGGCRTQPCLRFCAATPRNESKEAKREEKPENKVLSLLPCSRCKDTWLQPTSSSSSLLSLLWRLPLPWPAIPVLSRTCVSQITHPMV